MNILFYIEPLIQRDNPVMQEPWLHLHIKNMIEGLKDVDCNIFIASNSVLSEKLKDIEYKDRLKDVFSFEQKELKVFSSSSLEILRKWHEKTYTKEEKDIYIKLMLKKFGDINFDVIISFSPVPYLKEIYNDKLFLFCEYGMFSRKPYPRTYHLDPIDFGGYEYLDKYYFDIEKNTKLDVEEEKKFLDFLTRIKKIILKDNPFEEELKNLKQKYDYLLLLPMQASNYWAFDCETEYKSQFEYLEDVLIKTSKLENIGIIVTQHISNIFLNDTRNVEYFKNRYKNFILLETTKNYSEISPLLVPYVDGIIVVSTSVGYHSLLWDKKLITIGSKYLRKLSDSDTLENLDEVLKTPMKDRKKILYWLLTHYYILESYIKNNKWFGNFLIKSIENKKSMENFYERINDTNLLFDEFIKQCSLISDNIVGQYLQIYINYGNGYYEENSYKILYKNRIKINLENKFIEYILLKFREIDAVNIEENYYINKNNEIKKLIKSDSPNCYKTFGKSLLIDELNFLEYKINDEVSEINISIADYKILSKKEIFEELSNLELNFINLNKKEELLIQEKEILINQNKELLKENKNLVNEKNKTLKAKILQKIALIKSTVFKK